MVTQERLKQSSSMDDSSSSKMTGDGLWAGRTECSRKLELSTYFYLYLNAAN